MMKPKGKLFNIFINDILFILINNIFFYYNYIILYNYQ